MADQANPPVTGVAGGTGENNQDTSQTPLTYDAWIGQQPQEIRDLLDGNTRGLRSALESERGSRKDLEKQLRDLAGKAGKDTELQQQLTALASAQESANLRAEFYEQGHVEGVKNLKLAFLVAQQDELIDKRGRVNWNDMRARYPELFNVVPGKAPGNAGAGTGQPAPAQSPNQKMNEFIVHGGRR